MAIDETTNSESQIGSEETKVETPVIKKTLLTTNLQSNKQTTKSIIQESLKTEPKIVIAAVNSNVKSLSTHEKIIEAGKKSSTHAQILISSFESYIEKMDLKFPQDLIGGCRAQQNFYKSLVNSLNAEGSDFYQIINIILSYFKEHSKDSNGVLHDYNIFRFNKDIPTTINMSSVEVKSMERVITFFKTASGFNNLSEVKKHVDISRILPESLGQSRDKLIEYFSK